MPRHVDHDTRRRHVAAIAADVVAARGMEALTIRHVADAAGYSTTIVSHYFRDKKDLVLATYQVAADRSLARFDKVADGEGTLRRALEAVLPLDPDRRRNWTLMVAFWGSAATDPDLATEQRTRIRQLHSRIAQQLDEQDRAAGRTTTSDQRAVEADRLVTAVLGIGLQAVFDPSTWTANRQRDALARALEHETPTLAFYP